MALSKPLSENIQENWETLVSSLKGDELQNKLFGMKLINLREYEEIRSHKSKPVKNEEILLTMLHKSASEIDRIVTAIADVDEESAKLMKNDYHCRQEEYNTTMSVTQNGVLMVLPRWGGWMGGIYSIAHGLMYQLREEGRAVSCLLGATVADLSDDEKTHIKVLNVEILEPNIVSEIVPKCPEKRMQDTDSFEDLFDHILPILGKMKYVVLFSYVSYKLVHYLLDNSEASSCELVVVTNHLPRSSNIDFVQLARSAKAVFLVSNHMNPVLNNVNYVIPDFENLLETGVRKKTKRESLYRILIPWTGTIHDEFIHNCICAINMCNDTYLRSRRKTVEAFIQMPPDTDRMQSSYNLCRHKYHKSHKFWNAIKYISAQDIVNAAVHADIVIASGNFTESGFSGLEFLANGFCTIAPAQTDLANILHKVSPGNVDKFLLKALDGESTHKRNIVKWALRISAILSGKHNLMDEKGSVIRAVMLDLKRHALFVDGQKRLMETFTDTEVTGPSINLDRKSYLGSGTVGSVYKFNVSTAVKVIPIGRQNGNMLAASREIKVMGQLCSERPHSHVICLYSCARTTDFIYIFMELAMFSMQQCINKRKHQFTEEEKIDILRQVFSGLGHLHSNMIVHQDIKPSNIMFTGPRHIKLSDFGSARITFNQTTNDATSESHGTPYYQAPEVLIGGKRARPYSDVWSACLVGTEWFTEKYSWKSTGPQSYFIMKERKILPLELAKVPSDVQQILTLGLNYSTSERPSANAIKTKLLLCTEKYTQSHGADINERSESPPVKCTKL